MSFLCLLLNFYVSQLLLVKKNKAPLRNIGHFYLKYGAGASDLSIIWEFVGYEDSQVHPNLINQNLDFTKSLKWFLCMSQFKKC